MRTRTVETEGRRVIVVAFDKGEEVMAGLGQLARERELAGAGFTAIGAFSRAVLGYFDRERTEYQRIPVDEQVEVLSLIGDVAMSGDERVVHAHAVLGCRDGSTRGGHLLEADVWPTLEVVLSEVPVALHKVHDSETGLALLHLPER